MVGIPEGARILRRSPQRLLQFCVVVSSGLAVAALAWGAVLLIALPKRSRDLDGRLASGGQCIRW